MWLLAEIGHQEPRIDVLRARSTGKPRRGGACVKPVLFPGELVHGTPGSEIVATLIRHDGAVLREQAWPVVSRVFFDAVRGRDELAGGVVAPRRDLRLLDIPLMPGAAYLTFDRRDVVSIDGVRRVVVTPLDVFRLPAAQPGSHLLGRSMDTAPLLSLDDGTGGPKENPNGRIVVGPRRLHTGSQGVRYNIVIVGDGFQDRELAMFEARAKALTDNIKKEAPFCDLLPYLDVWCIQVASKDSGVDNCPYDGVLKDTFFNVEGGAISESSTFFTPTFEIVEDTVALIGSRVHLVIVLVNSATAGGNADYGHRTVYLPIMQDDATVGRFALHEMGHAIAGLADEYLAKRLQEDPDDLSHYRNATTKRRRAEGKVWWKDLAHPYELEGGELRAVHELGDPIDARTNRPITKPGHEDMLGLFWGAGFFQGNLPEGDAARYTSPNGAYYYRAMARCKMRWLSEPFCRVCQALITCSIRDDLGL